jgi:hypothetical protein
MDDSQMIEPLKAAAEYNNEITAQIACKNYGQAKQKILSALAHYPHDLGLLITANNLFRTCQDPEASLHYAKQIISHHPSYFDGYCRAAQDLVSSLRRHKEASEIIDVGLENFLTTHGFFTLRLSSTPIPGTTALRLIWAKSFFTSTLTSIPSTNLMLPFCCC